MKVKFLFFRKSVFIVVLLLGLGGYNAQNSKELYKTVNELPKRPESDKKEIILNNMYKEASIQEMPLDESNIIGAINRWHKHIYWRNRQTSTAYLMAMLLDPVTTEIATEIEKSLDKVTTTEEKIKIMHKWLQTNMVHTQMDSAFKDYPGNEPWGIQDLTFKPTYKKLLPSEMKAMRLHTNKISGKCITLANMITSIFIHLGVSADDILLVIMQLNNGKHGSALVRFEDEIVFTNNNRMDLFKNRPKNGSSKSTSVLALYNHRDLKPAYFNISLSDFDGKSHFENEYLFHGFTKYLKLTDQLYDFGMWPEYSLSNISKLRDEIFLGNPRSLVSELTKYAYQSLYVKYPEYYLTASMRSSLPRDLAETINSVDDVYDWIENHVRFGSIFPDSESRIMTADQVLVFQQGSLKDQGVLAYTLFKYKGYEPILFLTHVDAYVEVDGKLYSFREKKYINQISEDVLFKLVMKEQFPGLREARRKAQLAIHNKQYVEAFHLLQLNVELYPDAWQVYDDIGYPYRLMPEYDNAIKSYQKAEELKPGDVFRLYQMARLSLFVNQTANSLAFCKKGLAIEPGNPRLNSIQIEGLLLSGEIEKAKKIYQKYHALIIEKDPIKSKILSDFSRLDKAGITNDEINQFREFLSKY